MSFTYASTLCSCYPTRDFLRLHCCNLYKHSSLNHSHRELCLHQVSLLGVKLSGFTLASAAIVIIKPNYS